MTSASAVAPTDPQRPTALALLTATLPFLSTPLAFIAFGLAVSDSDDLVSGLSASWREGGLGMFLIVLASGLAAVASAALLFFGVQRGATSAFAGSAVATLPIVIGAGVQLDGLWSMVDAVAHAAPADRAVILAGGTAEVTVCVTFGFACALALAGASALGCLVGAGAQRGAARSLLASAAAAHALVAATFAVVLVRQARLSELFRAVANAAPESRLDLLVAGDASLAPLRLPLVAVVGVLAVVVAGGAFALRRSPTQAALLPLFALAGVSGVGVAAAARGQFARAFESLREPPGPALLRVDGVLPRAGPVDVVVEASALAGAETLAGEGGPKVALLGADTGAGPLRQLLETAARAGVTELELIGQGERRTLTLTSELGVLAEAMNRPERAVWIGLAEGPLDCADACRFATLSAQGLDVQGTAWTPAAGPAHAPGEPTPVYLRLPEPLEARSLVSAALAAWSHDAQLVVVVEPAPVPEEASTGGPYRDEIRRVVVQHRQEIQRCYEKTLRQNPTLAGKVKVAWTISAQGTTQDVASAEDELGDQATVSCLLATVRRWRFPKPADGQPVQVSYPWVFKPAE